MLAALTGAGVFGTLVQVPMRILPHWACRPFAGLWGVVGRWMVGRKLRPGSRTTVESEKVT